jgi:purine-nucleoside phosphorylase
LRKDAKFKDVIREGKFEIIEMENKNIFAFTRTLNNQKITLISN